MGELYKSGRGTLIEVEWMHLSRYCTILKTSTDDGINMLCIWISKKAMFVVKYDSSTYLICILRSVEVAYWYCLLILGVLSDQQSKPKDFQSIDIED